MLNTGQRFALIGSFVLLPMVLGIAGTAPGFEQKADALHSDLQSKECTIAVISEVKVVEYAGTRVIRIPLEGTVPNLTRTRDKYKVSVTFSSHGLMLNDHDGKYRTQDGKVANYIALRHSGIAVDGDRFEFKMFVPLNDLDMTSHEDTPLTVYAAILEDARVVAEAQPVELTIDSKWIPKVWFSDVDVYDAPVAPDENGIHAKARVLVNQFFDEPIRFEMIVMTENDKDIPVSDDQYRMGDDKAGTAWERSGPENYRIRKTDHILPLNVLRLPAGEHQLTVFLRALNAKGHIVGMTRPYEVEVTRK